MKRQFASAERSGRLKDLRLQGIRLNEERPVPFLDQEHAIKTQYYRDSRVP